jgi:hypothetical protein
MLLDIKWSISTAKAFPSLSLVDKVHLLKKLVDRHVVGVANAGGRGRQVAQKIYSSQMFNKEVDEYFNSQRAARGMCLVLANKSVYYKTAALKDLPRPKTSSSVYSLAMETLYVSPCDLLFLLTLCSLNHVFIPSLDHCLHSIPFHVY